MTIDGLKLSDAMRAKAEAIHTGAEENDMNPARGMATALALLTSPLKAEREIGKQLVRKWRVSHAKASEVE